MFTLWPLRNKPQTTFKPLTFPALHPIKTSEEMAAYKGRIIIYETTYPYLISAATPVIDPQKKDLKVGIVSNRSYVWDVGPCESGYEVQQLSVAGEAEHNQAMVNSMLEKADLKVRLPYPKELDSIREIVSNNKGEFPYPWGRNWKGEVNDILAVIDAQQAETKKPVTIRRLK